MFSRLFGEAAFAIPTITLLVLAIMPMLYSCAEQSDEHLKRMEQYNERSALQSESIINIDDVPQTQIVYLGRGYVDGAEVMIYSIPEFNRLCVSESMNRGRGLSCDALDESLTVEPIKATQ